MTRFRFLLLSTCFVLMSFATAAAQSGILIPAGSPEDQTLQAITAEQDDQKKLAMYGDFVAKFSSNPMAVAYGNAQISQIYSNGGDLKKALEAGDRAVAALPANLDLLVSQVNVAQQLKDAARSFGYAVQGGGAYEKTLHSAKPADMSDDDYSARQESMRRDMQSSHEYLEAIAFNGISSEPDAKVRMARIEQFTPAFPDSKFSGQVSEYAMMSLQGDLPRLVAYGEKTLQRDPRSLATLIMLANAYANDKKEASWLKAVEYGRKAIELAKPDAPDADDARKISAGVAHSAIAYALMQQEKTLPAITEFKLASALLANNPAAHAEVIYKLGFAYAKLKRYPEARETLSKGKDINGPYQQPIRELLGKVNAVAPAR